MHDIMQLAMHIYSSD